MYDDQANRGSINDYRDDDHKRWLSPLGIKSLHVDDDVDDEDCASLAWADAVEKSE